MKVYHSLLILLVLISLVGCGSATPEPLQLPTLAMTGVVSDAGNPAIPPLHDNSAVSTATPSPFTPTPLPITPTPFPTYAGIPTPDPPHPVITNAGEKTIIHTVTAGETLSYLAELYEVDLGTVLLLNDLDDDALLYVGQQLAVPYVIDLTSADFKIIPNSELVYGPAQQGFSVINTLILYNSGLLRYGEQVEEQTLSGAEIVQLVADRFQVNPRLLLAVLEHRAGLVTAATMPNDPYILGYDTAQLTGLYWQLARTANLLNAGYYGWLREDLRTIELDDETLSAINPTVNAGTVGMQMLFSAYDGATAYSWVYDTSADGFFATYHQLFGNPFAYTIEPLLPKTLRQPSLRLPWQDGQTWYFTGGPHGGFGWGTPWAALDFVPAGDRLGCYQAEDWVVAMSAGIVTRSSFGGVVVDLDGDGYAGTGWALHYLHIESRDRVATGTKLKSGDLIGHPSCEGGFSNGTHIHIARTYNGHWIESTGETPFELGGWVSQGLVFEYDGWLVKGEEVREACECREELNALVVE